MREEKGLLEYYEVVGSIETIVIVPKGSPQGIQTMKHWRRRTLGSRCLANAVTCWNGTRSPWRPAIA